ncbi:MAG: thioredoxin family protein [Candidatus Sumerlaeaceae bacterium]|nr:thioredoxin family protein [Candidatus Sumerlaeaceae bacterium]
MRRCIFIFFAMLGLSGSLRAGDLVIDPCDDPQYEVRTPTGHANTARLATMAGASTGDLALQVTYEYPPTAAYTASTRVVRSLAAPISLREADRILVDISVPAALPALMMTIDFIDEKGCQARIVSHDLFSKETNGWTTRAWSVSRLDKSRWAGEGRAVNLDRIVKVAYVVMAQEALPASGSFTFTLNNLRAQTGVAPGGSKSLINFQRYATPQALANGWQPVTPGTVISLTDGSQPSTKAMQVAGTVSQPGDTFLAEMAFDTPMDLSTARFVRLVMAGESSLASVNGIGLVRLVDMNGNCAEGIVWGWATEPEWSFMHLPFLSDGVERYTAERPDALEFGGMSCWREAYQPGRATQAKTDMTRIAKLQLGFRATGGSGYPLKNAAVRFEEVIVGIDFAAPTMPATNPVGATATTRRTPAPPPATPTPPVPIPTTVAWVESGPGALENALKAGRPVIIYFYATETPKCAQFESACLLTNDFIRRTGNFVCLRENVAEKRNLADRFGVYRVPHLIVLSQKGAVVSSFSNEINPRDVLNAMDALTQ